MKPHDPRNGCVNRLIHWDCHSNANNNNVFSSLSSLKWPFKCEEFHVLSSFSIKTASHNWWVQSFHFCDEPYWTHIAWCWFNVYYLLTQFNSYSIPSFPHLIHFPLASIWKLLVVAKNCEFCPGEAQVAACRVASWHMFLDDVVATMTRHLRSGLVDGFIYLLALVHNCWYLLVCSS